MESSEYREDNIANETWTLVHNFFHELNRECGSIRYNLKEINDHLGNLRMAILDSRRCFLIIDGITKNRRKLHPLRRELQKFAMIISSYYEATVIKLKQTMENGTALRAVERIESTYRDLEHDESHPWITIIEQISASSSDHDIATIDAFKTIFESLGVGIRRGSAPAAQSFGELADLLDEQKEILTEFIAKLKPLVESYTKPENTILDESTRWHLKGKICDINGLIGGYFSMMDAIIDNLFHSYKNITHETDDFSKLFIQILEAMKMKKMKERGGKFM